MVNRKFFEELSNVAFEKHLEIEEVCNAVQIALCKAVQSEGYDGNIQVEINMDAAKIRIYNCFKVVEDETPREKGDGQIYLAEAKAKRDRVRVGSEFKEEVPFSAIGRKGAYRFKQIFSQELRQCWVVKATDFFLGKEGEMVTATVERILDDKIILDLGMNVFARMPKEETIGEALIKGQKLQVCITKVEETTKGPHVYVSRSQKEIVKRLFEKYIPEIIEGVIDVMSIARKPGERTKVSVRSNNPNVDAKSACIGAGGSRIREINNELNGEKIDIFNYSDDPVRLVAEALTPARAMSVMIDEENHKATVIVPDDQLSLAIGKRGQNVTLASQATGWRIDIKDETTAYREEIKITYNV